LTSNANGRLQVNQAVDTFITFSVRFANSYLGGEMWIAWARFVGLQGDKPEEKVSAMTQLMVLERARVK
jgi:hypothetical protein